MTKGIAYLKFLESIDIEKDFDKLYEKLTMLSKKVFNVNNLLIHTICDDKGYKHSFDGAKVLIDSLEKKILKEREQSFCLR